MQGEGFKETYVPGCYHLPIVLLAYNAESLTVGGQRCTRK